MLRISSTYLASGNFLCKFCKGWRREGMKFQVMAFTHEFEKRYITSCQNTIKWTMTRLPYMSNVKRTPSYVSRIDQKCLKNKAGGESVSQSKRDGRGKAIGLLNCNVSQNCSERGDRKQIRSGTINSPVSLIERKNPAKRMISKAVKESLAKREESLIQQSEERTPGTFEKFRKTMKVKSNCKTFGTDGWSEKPKTGLDKLRSRPENIGRDSTDWVKETTDKADKAFVQFQEMLRVPESTDAELFQHEQALQRKTKMKPVKKKTVNVFKVSDQYVKQRLLKNKINVKIYDQARLLEEEEPQCEFAEVQCGRKKLYVAFLEDSTPEKVEDKLPTKAITPGSKGFPEKLMRMTPEKLSKITPEKIVKMIRDGPVNKRNLINTIHYKSSEGGQEKPRKGGRDRSLKLQIPRNNSDFKLVVNLKKPHNNMPSPIIHFKQKTPNGIVAKTVKFHIQKIEKYWFLTNSGKIRIRYLTGGLTNIKQRLLEKMEIPKILKHPIAISDQGKILFYERIEEDKPVGTVQGRSKTSDEPPKESLVKKLKLLNLKTEDKSEINKDTERKYLFKILRRKPRKAANEKIDEGKLIEAQLDNNVSRTFSSFDTLLQGMSKLKEDPGRDAGQGIKSDPGKKKVANEAPPAEKVANEAPPAEKKAANEAPPTEKKMSLPKEGPVNLNKIEFVQENILPKPKPKTVVPAWKEIEKINKEKQAELSKMLPSQLIDPYFLQMQQQRQSKQKSVQETNETETEPMRVPNEWDPARQGSTLPADEHVQQWNQLGQENVIAEETVSFPDTQENISQEDRSHPSENTIQDYNSQTSQQEETLAQWSPPPDSKTQQSQSSQTSTNPLEPSKISNLPSQNEFYYPELGNQRSRRANLPPPPSNEGTAHFASIFPESEESFVPVHVKVPSSFEGNEIRMYDTELEETIHRPILEDMKLKDSETVLAEDLPEYLSDNAINKWDDKNWDVRKNWETRSNKVPNLRKLVRANSGNANYVHSFIIESDTLGECYRAFRQTPDFAPKTAVEYNFKYDQEPEMRMFENVVAQNFTRVEDPDFIQVRRLRDDNPEETTVTEDVTVIRPKVKEASEISTSPGNQTHPPVELSTQNRTITNVYSAWVEGMNSAEESNHISSGPESSQITKIEVQPDANTESSTQRQDSLEMYHNHDIVPCISHSNGATEAAPDHPNLLPNHNFHSVYFSFGTPEQSLQTRPSYEDILESNFSYHLPSERDNSGIIADNVQEIMKEKEEKHENSKTLVSDPSKFIESDKIELPKTLDDPKRKIKIPKKPRDPLTVIADASGDGKNRCTEVKPKKSAEKPKEETDPKVKEEIMQKLKDELSSKLKNEWKVKLFDELADRIKPVIELKLTSDKPKNQIYLEKAKSEKLEAQKEQPQVKDQLKEELKELKEELKKIKMKEELKQELKSELKGEFTSRLAVADNQTLYSEPVLVKSEREKNAGSKQEDVQRPATSGKESGTSEHLEKDRKQDGYDYYQKSISVLAGWRDGHYDNNVGQRVQEKENNTTSHLGFQHQDDESPATFETTKYNNAKVQVKAEEDARNSPPHLPEKDHPYLPLWDNPPERDQPKRGPQYPHTQPNHKDHPYLPRWEPMPQRNPPTEPFHPQPQPPNQPYHPHTQPPNHPYQPQPQTPNQPYQPYQPQQPREPCHPQPQAPNQPYQPQTQPPNPPSQPQTPGYSPYPFHRPTQEASQNENQPEHPYWDHKIVTSTEEQSPFQDGYGQRNHFKQKVQPQQTSEPPNDPPQKDKAQTQRPQSSDDDALSQSGKKYFEGTLPETKMEEGKKSEGLKTKQKEGQEPGKKEDEKKLNQQSRAKFFRNLVPEKTPSEEKPDEKNQTEENQSKRYFRTLLPDQKTPGKFMRFKGDQKKSKGTKKEELEKEKSNKSPGEIKLKELPPTKPEIKKSADNKPAEILVKSIESIVEQSRKAEMETKKQVEATEQKKLIKQQQEAAAQKESETKKQLEATEQKELLRQQQEAAAKRDSEMRKQQEERDRESKEALEVKRRNELAKKVPGIAGYGATFLEQSVPVVRIPPDKKPDDSKDKTPTDERKIKLPGPESMTEKKSKPGDTEEKSAKSEATNAEKLKSFMDPLKFGTNLTDSENQASENDKNKPSPAEAPTNKAADKKEKLSPLLEWEKKILGGSSKSKTDEDKKDKAVTKSGSEKAATDKLKTAEEKSKIADLGKRKSNLWEWEKEIGKKTNAIFGGMPEPRKSDSDQLKVKEDTKTKEPDSAPKNDESTSADKTPKMHKEEDNEILQARLEHYLNIYDPPNKGGGGTDSNPPATTTMILPDLEEYDRSDLNDFFSTGSKSNDFNLCLPQEEAEEILKHNRKTTKSKTEQKEPEVSYVPLDQTYVNPTAEQMNLLMDPATRKTDNTSKPESQIHVVKLVFEDKKNGVIAEEENKRRSTEEENQKELTSFVELLRSVLSREQQERVNIPLQKEIGNEKERKPDLNLYVQLLKMAMTNGKNEIFQNKNHARAESLLGKTDLNLQSFIQLLRRTINNAQRDSKKILQEGAGKMVAEGETNRLDAFLQLFRKAIESAEYEVKEKMISKSGAGDAQRDAETDLQSFLQILKEAIAKAENQAESESEAIVPGMKAPHEPFTGDLGIMHNSKRHISVDPVESAKSKVGSDKFEFSALRKETKEAKNKSEDDGSTKKSDKKRTKAAEETTEDSLGVITNTKKYKKKEQKKAKEDGEEAMGELKKTIQVDKIIVNIKADSEEKEINERRRKPSRRTHRKMEEAAEEEVEEEEKYTRKKKSPQRQRLEEEIVPKKKREVSEEKRKRRGESSSEDDTIKLAKAIPEKEPEVEPGCTKMLEIAEETTPVQYNSSEGDWAKRDFVEPVEMSPKPKRDSFMGERVVKEFTIREEPFEIEPVRGKSKAVYSKRDVQSVESNIRAARLDKGYLKEGKNGKSPRTIFPDSSNAEFTRRYPAKEYEAEEENDESSSSGHSKFSKKNSKSFCGTEQSKMEEIRKAVKEEKSEEESIKFLQGKRDPKGYVKTAKKNVSGITQKRDLQTLATVMLRNADEKREPNRLVMKKLLGNRAVEDRPVGESVLGDALRHRIASAPYRKTELPRSERELSPIKDKTELKTVRVTEEAPEGATHKRLIEAVAKKANEIPCAVAVDPENPPLPAPLVAGAILSPESRRSRTKFSWPKMGQVKK